MKITKAKEEHTVYNITVNSVELENIIDALMDEAYAQRDFANRKKKEMDLYEDLDGKKWERAFKWYNTASAKADDLKKMIQHLSMYYSAE